MNKCPLVIRILLGGAICGCFLGLGAGAVLGAVYGAIVGNISLGLDWALLGGLIFSVAGAIYGLILGPPKETLHAKAADEGSRGDAPIQAGGREHVPWRDAIEPDAAASPKKSHFIV